MTDHREVMRMALEALELGEAAAEECAMRYHDSMRGYRQATHDALDAQVAQIRTAIKALRAAIDEPVPEPGAWMDREGDIYPMPERKGWAPPHTLLYAHPPAPPAADADTITVRLEKYQHFRLGFIIMNAHRADIINQETREEFLALLGTFPDAAGKGKP